MSDNGKVSKDPMLSYFPQIMERFFVIDDELAAKVLEIDQAILALGKMIHDDLKLIEEKAPFTKRFEFKGEQTFKLQSFEDDAAKCIQTIRMVLSYYQEVLEKLARTTKELDLPKDVRVPYYVQPTEGMVPIDQSSMIENLLSFSQKIKDEKKRQSNEHLKPYSAIIRHAHETLERFDTFVLQHEEFEYIYSRWGGRVMGGYMKTEKRNFTKLMDILMPVVDAGLRYHQKSMQETFATAASDLAKVAQARREANENMRQIGVGIGQSWKSAVKPPEQSA